MQELIHTIEVVTQTQSDLPFSVYHSFYEQRLLGVPVAKPLLVVVLQGSKHLGEKGHIKCNAGEFVFLSDSPKLDMRNIPNDEAYHALLIEFDNDDFAVFKHLDRVQEPVDMSQSHFGGQVSHALKACITQFIECITWASKDLLTHRKAEILLLLYALGFKHIRFMAKTASVSSRIHRILQRNSYADLKQSQLCQTLAMSESTLRRRLQAEGVTLQQIKDSARLGQGLHLLQSTCSPIGKIASQCGYGSQSRFTEKFKRHFGLTPSQLRSTKMKEQGEKLADLV